jgi:endogenous inhibitor of DNA gyrase (YacG/DUF329 family)
MTDRMKDEAAGPRSRACPICCKPTVEEVRPFCSRRCAEIDLGRWLKGVYAIPARPSAEEGEAETETDEKPGGRDARGPR